MRPTIYDPPINYRERLSLALFIFLLLVLVLLCISCAPHSSHTLTLDQQAASAVQITTYCKATQTSKDDAWSGSGAVIDARHVITAGHVVNCLDQKIDHIDITGGLAGNQIRHVTLIVADFVHDAALLTLEEPLLEAPWVDVVEPEIGRRACSESAVPERGRHCGIVREVRYRDIRQLSVDVDVSFTIASGNSGSGVYDSEGRLIGVVTHSRSVGKPPGGLVTSLYSLKIFPTRNE